MPEDFNFNLHPPYIFYTIALTLTQHCLVVIVSDGDTLTVALYDVCDAT
jgi:hypothetical protein